MTYASLPCWRRRLGVFGSSRCNGFAMDGRDGFVVGGGGSRGGGPGRWWTPRRRPRSPTLRRLYEAGPLSCGGRVATWMKTARAEGSSTRLDHLRAMRRLIWLLRRGGGPGTVGFGGDLDEYCAGRGSVDHDWIVFGQCEGRSGCYAGAAASDQVVCVVAVGRLASCGRRVVSSVRFFAGFPHKQVFV